MPPIYHVRQPGALCRSAHSPQPVVFCCSCMVAVFCFPPHPNPGARRRALPIVLEMRCKGPGGYTLVEVIIALLVFMTGALALAAGSAVVVREMRTSSLRAEAGRLIASRLEIVQSICPIAQSGSETSGSIVSEWAVAPLDSASVRLTGTVSYLAPRGRRTEAYSNIVVCR